MIYNNEYATIDNEKANLFGKFFASIYKQYDDDISKDNALLSFIKSRDDDWYFNITITLDVFQQALKRMDISKEVSPDKWQRCFYVNAQIF